MLHCARCAEALPAAVCFCPSCGERVGTVSLMATMAFVISLGGRPAFGTAALEE